MKSAPALAKYREKYRNLALDLAAEIAKIPQATDCSTELAVVQVFKGSKASTELLIDAFWLLDSSEYEFADWKQWHSKLRRTRNHPVHGPALFSAMRKELV